MSLFKTIPYKKADFRCSRQEAIANLVKAATRLVKEARWHPYRSKINELRKPLIQFRLSKP